MATLDADGRSLPGVLVREKGRKGFVKIEEQESPLLTTGELAKLLKTNMAHIRRLASKHCLPGVVLMGNRYYFKRAALTHFFAAEGE